MPAGDGTTYRGVRRNGHIDDIDADLDHLQRRSAAGAPASLSKYFVPLACVLTACVVTVLSLIAWSSVGPAGVGTANPANDPTIQEAQQTALTIQQLRKDQEHMMQMLQSLVAAQGNVSTAVHAVQEHQKQQTKAIAAAAAAAAASDRSSTTEKDQPEAPAAKESALPQVPPAIAAIPALTSLHNAVLRSSKDFEQHRQVVQQLLDKLVHMEAAAAQQEVQKQLQIKQEPLKLFVYELYKLMLGSERLIPCREDTTLVAGDAINSKAAAGAPASNISSMTVSNSSSSGSSSTSTSSSRTNSSRANSNNDGGSNSSSTGDSPKYYFATNLRDNSVQMPHFTLQLLQTLLRLPHNSAFVSVYESNSDDGAHGWIDVMELALNVIGTPNRLIARGMLVRTEGQHRIQFLAQVRNMALAPLYSYYAQQRSAAASSSNSSSSGSRTGSTEDGGSSSEDGDSSSSSSSLPPGALPWAPDYVVFINDVYFCWSMVLRLMNYRADITCGLDWWQNKDATVSLPHNLRQKSHQPKPVIPEQYKLEGPLSNALSPDTVNPIVFYDVWVSRDIAGSKLWWTYPFIMDPKSSHVVAKGLPVRASCCWNGLVVLRAEPFAAGVRFRTQQPGECMASECTLMCDDFARLGYDNVVIDAGVQVAYDWPLAREMLAVGIEGVGQSTWAQVKAAGVAQADRKPAYSNMECCNLKPGAKWVSFFTDCQRWDIMINNYTREAMKISEKTWGG